MKLISPFASLIQGGVILNLKISAAGGDNIQLDFLPQGKDSKTGVALPPKALIGTAEEIDANLEAFLQKYAPSVARVAEVVANADAELKTIEEAAAAQAKKAIDEKSKNKSTPAKPGSKPSSAPPRKDMKAGLLGGDADDNNEETDDVESTMLLTTGTGTGTGTGTDAAPAAASTPAAAPAPIDGVSQGLFVV